MNVRNGDTRVEKFVDGGVGSSESITVREVPHKELEN